MRYPRILICMGLVAIAFAWVVIGASWILNPWFVFTEDAFSDFGGSESCCPELYNYGLMITGMLIVLYGLAICIVADEKLEVAGGSYVILAGIFLALIGVFPLGNKASYIRFLMVFPPDVHGPHDPRSRNAQKRACF